MNEWTFARKRKAVVDTQPKEPQRVAVLFRVSTEGQETELQEREVREEIAKHGWPIVREFKEKVSGLKNETLIESVRAGAKAGEFDTLYVWALDRLTRQGARVLHNILYELKQAGVGVRSLKEPWLDTAGPFGDVMISLVGCVANLESLRKRDRSLSGLKLAHGKGYAVAAPPYGYQRVPVMKSDGVTRDYTLLTINKKQAPAVVQAFKLYAAGDGLARLVAALTDADVPPPRKGRWSLAR